MKATVTVPLCADCGGTKIGEIELHSSDCASLRRAREERSASPLLELATDDQLREECSRRGMTALGLAQWSDDLLRAECVRRGKLPEAQWSDEHGDWRGVAIKRLEAHDRMRDERDEWKRRAEAAEQALKFVSDGGRANWQTRDMLRVESGPGIERMPVPRSDNSVAWLDEDLLCEDAK